MSPGGDVLALGIPQRLFDLSVAPVSNAGSFDPAPDGSRFVVLLEEAQQKSLPKRTHLTMVFDFLEELERRSRPPFADDRDSENPNRKAFPALV